MGTGPDARLLRLGDDAGQYPRVVHANCRPQPYSHPNVGEGTKRHQREDEADASDSYNYPGVTNQVVVAPETYTTLAQHPNIVGCKMQDNT